MKSESPSLLKRRKDHFLRTCPRISYTGTLYHGSPPEGLHEIFAAGAIHPPGHDELGIRLFSTSLNHHMIRFAGEGSGLEFEVENLPCIQLSEFYRSLAAAHEATTDFWWDLIKENPPMEEEADRLGYTEHGGNASISPDQFSQLLPDDIQAICLPGWKSQLENHEAEIAIRENGCSTLWNSISCIIINGKPHSPEEFELECHREPLTAAAQAVYDAWEQNHEGTDPELGTGGICDRITEAFAQTLAQLGWETDEGGQEGDDHSFLLASKQTEKFLIDIPSHTYETGAGYSWKKKPGIRFQPEDLIIQPI